MSKYDDLLERSKYDDLLDAPRTALRQSVSGVIDRDPEKSAQVVDLAERTGLPLPLVQRNREQVERRDELTKYDRLLEKSPEVARFLSEPDNAAVARDDIESLSGLEWATKAFSAAHAEQWKTIELGTLRARQLTRDLTPEENARVTALKAEITGSDFGAEDWYEKIVVETGRLLPTMEHSTLAGIQMGATTGLGAAGVAAIAGQAGPQVATPEEIITVPVAGALGFRVGAASGAAKAAYELEAGLAFDEFLDIKDENGQGLDVGIARGAAQMVGVVNAGLESLGLAAILKRIPGVRRFVPSLGREAVKEALSRATFRQALQTFAAGYAMSVGTEVTTEVLQEATTILGAEVAGKLSEGDFQGMTAEQIGARLAEIAVKTTQGMAVIGGVGPGAQFVADAQRVRQADQNQAVFEAIGQHATDSKLRQRLPERFRQYVASLREGGEVQDVRIPVEEFARYFQTQGLDPTEVAREVTGSDAAYAEAQAAGTDLVIPLEAYATRLAPTDHHAALMPNLRLRPDDMTAREAEQWRARAESLTQELADLAPGTETAHPIYDDVLGQLLGSGIERGAAELQAKLMSLTFENLGKRNNIDPIELWNRYDLRVRQEVPAVLQSVSSFDTNLDPLIDRLRSGALPSEREVYGPSLVDFLLEKGGLQDQGGELSARDAGKSVRGLVKKTGRTFDEAVELAAEAGYLEQGSTQNELLSALDRELGGERVYRPNALNQQLLDLRMALDDLGDFLGRQGVDLAQTDNAAVRQLLQSQQTLEQPAAPGDDSTDFPLSAVHNLTAENLKFADQMGGIAVPSIAIVPEGQTMRNYGEITMIGTRELGDPKNQPTFDADAYTATFPRPEYPKVRSAKAQKVVDEFRPFSKLFEDRSMLDQIWDNAVNRPNPAETISQMTRPNEAAVAWFLSDTGGKKFEPVMKDYVPDRWEWVAMPSFKAYVEAGGSMNPDYGSAEHKALTDAARAAHEEYLESTGADDEIKQMLRESREEAMSDEGLFPFGPIFKISENYKRLGTQVIDDPATRERMNELLKGREAEFQAWATDKIMSMYGAPFLKIGAKKRPYTLDSIVEYMTRGRTHAKEETLTFGEGKARAASATKFGDLEWMRNAAREFIKPEEEVSAAREHAKELMEQYRTAVIEHYEGRDWRGHIDTWRALDSSMQAIAKWAKNRLRQGGKAALRAALRQEGFKGVPDDVIDLGVEAGEAFLAAPVPYFESKPQRAVGIDEFAGAVIPENASDETKALLDKHGVPYRTYPVGDGIDREKSRAKVVVDFRRELAESGKATLFQSAVPADPTQRTWYRGQIGAKAAEDPFAATAEGRAPSFADDPEVASVYATNPQAAGLYSPFGEVPADAASGGNVAPYRISGKVFDIAQYQGAHGTETGMSPDQVDAAVAALGIDPADAVFQWTAKYSDEEGSQWDAAEDNPPRSTLVMEAYQFADHPEVQRALKERGYSAMHFKGAVSGETAPDGMPWAETKVHGELRVVDPSALKSVFAQTVDNSRRGSIEFGPSRKFTINLLKNRDLSTFLHESAHFYLEVLGDLAEAADAPEQIVQDYAAIMKWMGVESRQAIKVEHHEKFARGFEAYLFEGKAPNVELQNAFARFRAWLVSIYRKLTALNVELTQEVRNVFDRLIATDDAIAAAEEAQNYVPLFTTAEAAGMSPEQFAAYRKTVQDARLQAEDDLSRKLLAVMTREQKAWWKDRRKEVHASVTAEVHGMRVYRALSFLRFGQNPDGTEVAGVAAVKLDKKALTDEFRYPGDFLKRLPGAGKNKVYAAEGGVHPDIVAAMFGYRGTSELITDLINARPMKELIEAETDAKMRELFPDPLVDGSLAEEAIQAVHSGQRAELLAAELRALKRKAREVGPFVRAAQESERQQRRQSLEANRAQMPDGDELKLIRAAAERVVNGKRMRDISPATYRVAEAKASRAAFEAAAKGDYQVAYFEKRKQLLNHELFSAAEQAVEDAEAIRDYFRSFGKKAKRERLGKANDGSLEKIEALLASIDLGRISNKAIDRRVVLEGIRQQIANGDLMADPETVKRLEGAVRNWRELPYGDLVGMQDIVKQLEHQATELSEAIVNGEKVKIKEAAEGVAASVRASNKVVGFLLGTPRTADKVRRAVRQSLYSWLRPAELARQLDGGKDFGATLRTIIEPIRRAYAERLLPMEAKIREDVANLYRQAYTNDELAGLGVRGAMPEIDANATRGDLLSLALNWGNVGNRQALLDSTLPGGRKPFTEEKIAQALGRLTAKDWAFVESVWTYIDGYWPQLAAIEKRRRGVAPKKVEAASFTVMTADGQRLEIKGGYYPLKYDPLLSSQQRADQVEQDFAKFVSVGSLASSTRAGATIERVGSGGRPVRLGLGVIDQHLSEVVRDIAIGDEVRFVYRILQRPEIKGAMAETGNEDALETLRMWLKDAAVGEMAAHDFPSKAAAWARIGFTKAKLAWNVTTTLLQVTGLPQTMVVVGPKAFAHGVGRYLANPLRAHRELMAESAFMRARYETNAWNKDVSDTRAYLETFLGPVPTKFKTAINRLSYSYFWPIAKVQMLVDGITWTAGYWKGVNEKGLAPGSTDAIVYADSLVENAQTSGFFVDRSAIERGSLSINQRQSQFVKLWTTLISYMLAKGNIAYSKGRAFARAPSLWGATTLAGDIVMLYAIEAILAGAIRGQLPDDDDESWPGYIAKQSAASAISGVPFVREVTAGFYGSGNTPVGGLASDFAKALMQTQQGEVDIAAFKAWNNLGGTLFHYPAGQVNRTVEALWADAEGEDVALYEYLTGPRKED